MGCVLRPHLVAWRVASSGFSSTSFGGSSPDQSCAYDVLRVSPSANRDEIKTAFRKTARLMHPDAGPLQEKDKRTDKFVKVVAAYEILSCEKRRVLYDAERSANERWGKSIGKTKDTNDGKTNSPSSSPWEFLVTHSEVLRGYNSSIDALVPKGVLRRDIYAALGDVLVGPELDVEAVKNGDAFPKFFEAEERARSANVPSDIAKGLTTEGVDLMHIVSGRTLFAAVRERSDLKIEGNGEIRKLFPPSNGDGDADGTRTANTLSKQQTETHPSPDAVLELTLSGRVVATAVRHTRNGEVVVYDETERETQKQKNRKFREASLFAANQNNYAGFVGTGDDLTFQSAERNYQNSEDDPFKHKGVHGEVFTITGLTGSFDSASVKNVLGHVTHVVTAHATPGVTHLHWFCSRSKKVVGKATRAWLPPTELWLVQPRSNEHSTGGWYFELPPGPPGGSQRQKALAQIEADVDEILKQNKHGAKRDVFQEVADDMGNMKQFFKGDGVGTKKILPVALPPAAALFTTAFRLLDRERGEEHGVQGVAQRAWSSVFGGRY